MNIGVLTEDLSYEPKGALIKPPEWPEFDSDWKLTPGSDESNVKYVHPDYPPLVFIWDQRTNSLSATVVYHTAPHYISTKMARCHYPELFSAFVTTMIRVAETPFHNIEPIHIEVS
mgnify:FL=1